MTYHNAMRFNFITEHGPGVDCQTISRISVMQVGTRELCLDLHIFVRHTNWD